VGTIEPGGPATERRSRSRRRRCAWLRLSIAGVVIPAAACTSLGGGFGTGRVSSDDLLAGASLGVAPGQVTGIADGSSVLAVSPEMRAFIDKHVDLQGGDALKLHQLLYAIMDTRTFGVAYDDKTHTAAETFRLRKGNCLSFSNMFVAMARDVGLSAHFQEVDIPPDWTLDRDTYVLNQHVNVRVDLSRAGAKIVDFNIGDLKSSYEMQEISDQQALAHYFNNIGVEHMLAGDTAGALACFRRAIVDYDRDFSPAWTNLGTLYLRAGDAVRAEAAYLRALKADDADLVAMSNLARLYDREGDPERAAAYRKRVARHRWLNPYYRFELARRAYEAGHFNEAISHLKYAIRERPKEDEFCHLLALVYLRDGNGRAARHWLTRAQEVAGTEVLRRKYANEIDELLPRADKNRH
jgi:Flp pilus assembly protein TadD